MRNSTILLIISLFVLIIFSSCDLNNRTTTTTCKTDWTVMAYLAGDANGLTSALEEDLNEMVTGTNNKMRIIAMLDTIDGTTMYQVTKNNKKQIYGGDILPEINKKSTAYLNTGDATTLKKFITFCKETYPAQKYCLIVGSHGRGVMEDSRSGQSTMPVSKNFSFSSDNSSNGDWIYTSELTSVYDYDENIDLFVIDVCNLAFIEIMYQYRVGNGSFNADYILTSLPLQRTDGLPYNDVFANVTPNMTAVEFGKLFLEKKQLFDSNKISWVAPFQSMVLADTSKLENAKNKIDDVAKQLADKFDIYQACVQTSNEYFMNSDSKNSMRDAYQIFDNLSKWEPTQDITADLSDNLKILCSEAAVAIADCVAASFLQPVNSSYTETPFTAGSNGLCIFAPITYSQWYICRSYNAINTKQMLGLVGPGQYDWCINNSSADNLIVDNWFELLDYYHDSSSNYNGYHY